MHMIFVALLAAGLIGPLENNVVDPAWLEQNLNRPDVLVVEIGSGPAVDRPHIPGARFVAIEQIVKREGWPPDELLPADQLARAFENAGVGDEGRIVLYSADPLFATRAWLTLDYLGQGDRTAILDGGFKRWMTEKRTVASQRTPHMPKTFTAYPNPARLISHPDLRAAVDSGQVVLIDARSAHEFHGFRRGKSVIRRGHIPGAACEPWQSNLTGNGSFQPADQLKAKYATAIGKPDARVVVYCRTGMEASMPYFILRSLGYDVVFFDGSFAEWSRDKTAPVAKLSSKR